MISFTCLPKGTFVQRNYMLKPTGHYNLPADISIPFFA